MYNVSCIICLLISCGHCYQSCNDPLVSYHYWEITRCSLFTMIVTRNFFNGISPTQKSPTQNHLIVSNAAFRPPDSSAQLISKSFYLPRTASIEPEQEQRQKRVWRRQHRDLLLDTFHQNHRLRKLLSDLSDKDSDPLRLLEKYEDWDANQFWLVATFLVENNRVDEVLQVVPIYHPKSPHLCKPAT